MKKLLIVLIVAGMLIGAGGCLEGRIGYKADCARQDAWFAARRIAKDEADKKRRKVYIENHPRIGEHIKKWIRDGWAARGMTREQVIAAKGRPSNINYSIGSWGTHEQWIYSTYFAGRRIGTSQYFYFENGILTSYQF